MQHIPKNISFSRSQIIEAMTNYYLSGGVEGGRCSHWQFQNDAWLETKWSMLTSDWKRDIAQWWLEVTAVSNNGVPFWVDNLEGYQPIETLKNQRPDTKYWSSSNVIANS
jgi:hypothetical protein